MGSASYEICIRLGSFADLLSSIRASPCEQAVRSSHSCACGQMARHLQGGRALLHSSSPNAWTLLKRRPTPGGPAGFEGTCALAPSIAAAFADNLLPNAAARWGPLFPCRVAAGEAAYNVSGASFRASYYDVTGASPGVTNSSGQIPQNATIYFAVGCPSEFQIVLGFCVRV